MTKEKYLDKKSVYAKCISSGIEGVPVWVRFHKQNGEERELMGQVIINERMVGSPDKPIVIQDTEGKFKSFLPSLVLQIKMGE